MTEVQHCFPAPARVFLLRVLDQKHRQARETYDRARGDLAATAPGNGLRSGQHELRQWKLSQTSLGDVAYAILQAAIEASQLYDVILDYVRCTCVENSIKSFLLSQLKYSLHAAHGGATIQAPAHLRGEFLLEHNRPRFAEVRVDLEKARVASNKRLAKRGTAAKTMKETLVKDRRRNRPDVLNILIASPSDVGTERDAATSAIHDWNASQSGTMLILLNPLRWESHSFPQYGDRPQGLLNRQIVEQGDVLIGIFGARLGTPTGKAASGTIEEIEHFRSADKYIALYFSTADVPRDVDRVQLDAVEEYRRVREKDTLYASFSSAEDLKDRLAKHLPRIVAEVGRKLELGIWSEDAAPVQSSLTQVAPLDLQTRIVESSPTGSILEIDASRPIKLFQVDFLDRQNIRISKETFEADGEKLRVPLRHAELVKIWNLTPGGVVPIKFRLHIEDGGAKRTDVIEAGLQMTQRMEGSALTMYFDVLD